jgi:hypothetical protein
MIPWTDIEVRQMEYEQRVRRIEQTHWMQLEPTPMITVDRWQWRVMSKLGSWLVELGCRLQTHVERARQVVRTSPMAMEANSNSTQPCP